VCLLACLSVHAQKTISQDYRTQVDRLGEITPVGANVFGDTTDISTGETSFHHTVVSLSGNNALPVDVTLAFKLYDVGTGELYHLSFERPYISGVFSASTGWVATAQDGSASKARCSQSNGSPPEVNNTDGKPETFFSDEYWHGNHLVLPGGGTTLMRQLMTSNTTGPTDGPDYRWTTNSHWYFSCVTKADGSETFIGRSPDGLKYYFDEAQIGDGGLLPIKKEAFLGGTTVLQRREIRFFASKIEDRFGNWVKHEPTANGFLISSSDGRTIIATSTATGFDIQSGSRTWQIENLANGVRVVNPDVSEWKLTYSGTITRTQSAIGCGSYPATYTGSSTVTVNASSGAVGVFNLAPVRLGTSYVTYQCMTDDPSEGGYPRDPILYDVIGLTSKVITGAGLDLPLTWVTEYGPADGCYTQPNLWNFSCVSGAPSTRYVAVSGPDGTYVRYTYDNKFRSPTEGSLLKEETGSSSSAIDRTQTTAWVSFNALGSPGNTAGGNYSEGFISAPQKKTIAEKTGTLFTWEAVSFDAYQQVTEAKRYSSVSPTVVDEQTTYLNDLPHWILGLPAQTKNLNYGEVVDKYVYDLDRVTLAEQWRFGQKLMTYTYDAQGEPASITDGNTHTTTLTNYKRGIPQTITTPDNKTQSVVVDDFGQIGSLTDQVGSTTLYSYDPMGRLTGITYPTGDEQVWLPQTYAYAYVTSTELGIPAGHWRRTVSHGGARVVTYFDALLRPILTTQSIVGTDISQRTDYDSRGMTTFASYPVLGLPARTSITAGITNTYDALGRLTKIEQSSELGPLTTTTAYPAGATLQVTDPKHNVTTTTYQAFDQPSYDAVISVVAPAGVNQAITRDLYGNPQSIRQWGVGGDVTKKLVYDSFRRLCRTSEPESYSTVMAYDSANNLAWSAEGQVIPDTDTTCAQGQVLAADKTTRGYDSLNRLKTVLPPAGTQSTSYTYDDLGNLKTSSSGISTWSATYNKRGMLTGESLLLVGQNPWAIGYAHDTYGHLSLIQYPDGESVSYAPDALGRATRVGSYLTNIKYFPNGEVSQFDYANGAAYVADQNSRQLLSSFSYGLGGTEQLSKEMDYDPNGNITGIIDWIDRTRDKTFGYDPLNRLTSASAAALWGTETYTYDPLNNILSRVNGTQTTTYNYSQNRLMSLTGAGATSFVYDTRGNVTSKGAVTLSFDQKNQLLGLPGQVAYAYDAAGRRVSKTPTGGASTYTFYNQAGQLMYQFEPALAKTTSFAYLGRKLVGDNESIVVGAPGAVSFSANPNDGSYTVSWGAAPAATSYLLQESVNGGGWTTVYSGGAANTSLSGRAGGSYLYRVEGCIGTTCGAWTSSATLGVRPTLPTVTAPSGTINGTYAVTWTAPASATGYDVQESVDGGAWATIASSTTATSISRPGTTSGSYNYQVSAKNVYGSRGWAASSAVTVDTTYGVLPAAPTPLTVPSTSNTGGASLSWGVADLATRYVVEQSSDGGTSWADIYNDSGTSTMVSGLANGNYLFQVQACNTYGCSPWTAGSATLVVTNPPTTAPTVSTPTNSATGNFTVSWTAVSAATSYTLQERINSGGWATIQTSSATSKAISGKVNGSYGYQVQACNIGGCGPWSSVGTTAVLLPPALPASITVPSTSNGSIAVSWAASTTATSYTLQQKLGSGSWVTVYTGATTSSTRTVTASGSYTYQVQACNASGCSAYKASSAVTVTLPPASGPSLTVPASSTTGSYTVSWSAVSGATSYTLQEQVNGGAWATIQTSSAISKAISGKGNGTYGYRAQACNVGGCGPWSAIASIGVTLIPATPTGLSGTIWVFSGDALSSAGTSAGSVDGALAKTNSTLLPNSSPDTYELDAAWSASGGATSYNVQYCRSGICLTKTTTSNYISSIPVNGTNYIISVRACNVAGCSAYSATVTPTVKQG